MKIKMNGLTSVKELAIDHELTVHAIKLGVLVHKSVCTYLQQ